MSDKTEKLFENRQHNPEKLLEFGFIRCGQVYIYRKSLDGSGFELTVTVSDNGKVSSGIVDPVLGEPYTLHLDDSAVGNFVGGVRNGYEALLTEIAEACFERTAYYSGQARELAVYAGERYGDRLEFLWEKLSDGAILRRQDSGKWYAVFITLPRSRLGIEGEGNVEIVDLHAVPEQVARLVDGKLFFPGYHMNKKYWYTAVLDGRVETELLLRLLDGSYEIAKNNHIKRKK